MLHWTFHPGQHAWIAHYLDLDWCVAHTAMEQKATFLGAALEPTLENAEWVIRQLQNPAIWTYGEITYL